MKQVKKPDFMNLSPLLKLVPPVLISILLGLVPAVAADESGGSQPAQDFSGPWVWTSAGFGGGPMRATLSLKQDGTALSGMYEGGFGKSEIEGGVADAAGISFKITRQFGDRTVTSKFAGKVEGKLLVGSMAMEGFDQPRSIDWSAYRAPEIDPSGLWKWEAIGGRDGSKRDNWVKLAYADGELAGTYRTSSSQAPIVDAVLDGKNISFKVERRMGERTFTTAYAGELGQQGISGKITSRRGDEERVMDWMASRDVPVVDPLGTWAWASRGRNGEESESKITITKEGGRLAGSIGARGEETPIEDVQLEGDVLSFKVTRETDRGAFSANYSGQIDEDIFKANVGMTFGDRTFNRIIVAKRVLPEAIPAGTWIWTTRNWRGGENIKNKLTLAQADGRITGSLVTGDQHSAIEEVALEGNQISFEVQRTFRDNPVKLRFSGQIRGDSIVGSYRFGDSGGWALTWAAERAGE
jgi:hypothetical protein